MDADMDFIQDEESSDLLAQERVITGGLETPTHDGPNKKYCNFFSKWENVQNGNQAKKSPIG
jgi:hypothetical protein